VRRRQVVLPAARAVFPGDPGGSAERRPECGEKGSHPLITVSASKVQSWLCFIVFIADLLRMIHGWGHIEAFLPRLGFLTWLF